MSNNNKIIWEKWIDPYLNEKPETELPDFIEEETQQFLNEYEEGSELEDDSLDVKPHKMYAIASPLGIIPYNEYTASSKIFNFWIGHTNFDITEDILSILDNAYGVEILDIFTRYRFRIAIGKSFQDRDVMNNINILINNYFNGSSNG